MRQAAFQLVDALFQLLVHGREYAKPVKVLQPSKRENRGALVVAAAIIVSRNIADFAGAFAHVMVVEDFLLHDSQTDPRPMRIPRIGGELVAANAPTITQGERRSD